MRILNTVVCGVVLMMFAAGCTQVGTVPLTRNPTLKGRDTVLTPAPTDNPPLLECTALTEDEIQLVDHQNDSLYGGEVVKTTKVAATYFSVVAAKITGAIDGVEGANDQHPKDVTLTWSFRDYGTFIRPILIENNWGVGSNTRSWHFEEILYGAQMREHALSCLD